MLIETEVRTDLEKTPRVLQVSSMFDAPVETKTSRAWSIDLPLEDQDWSIGLITGPSGSGKSTVARHVWGSEVDKKIRWSRQPVIDNFPKDLGIREITGLLSSVGLSSPPAWLRPHATLSNGEAFRADVALRLATTKPGKTAVIDEFTSVVDRQVAKVASHAVQKTVRRTGSQRMVAVTCHYDVIEWLQPDWILDMTDGSFAWRSVRPHPRLSFDVHRADTSLWPVFAPHHYLSAEIHRSARCYALWTDGRPVAFASYLHFPHWKTRNIKQAHRIVTLPDWQGLGIGMILSEWIGQRLWDEGFRFRITSAHPAVKGYCAKSKRWRDETNRTMKGRIQHGQVDSRPSLTRGALDLRRFTTRTFQFTPPATATTASDGPATGAQCEGASGSGSPSGSGP